MGWDGMRWVESVNAAIHYIEEHITEELSVEDIARHLVLLFTKGIFHALRLYVSGI